ncbi:MAG: hypothetical protein IJO34_04030 [Akkermansia sp.]|nr:hypothetical protein [Akkermansia sp.]
MLATALDLVYSAKMASIVSRALSAFFLGALSCWAEPTAEPTQEELLKAAALYTMPPVWGDSTRALQLRMEGMREVRAEKLAEDVYLLRFEEGREERNEAVYVRYMLVRRECGQWWGIQMLDFRIACDNVASHSWDGTVLQLLTATGHLVADMATDGSFADAPQYVQLRYMGFESGIVRVEVHNTLDIPVRLLPGLFEVNGLMGQPAMHDMVYRACLRKECVLQPHETRHLELPLSINSFFNSPQREKMEIAEPYVSYVAFSAPVSVRARAHEYVPYVIRRADSPNMSSSPLCEDYAWKMNYEPGLTSGFDGSVRTAQLWRRENGRWHLLRQLADKARSEARFDVDAATTYRLSGQVLYMGRPTEHSNPRVALLLPLTSGSREVELLPDHMLDISMCLNEKKPETWYLRHGELRFPVEIVRERESVHKMPPSLRHLSRRHRLSLSLPAANGEFYRLTLGPAELRVLVCDANADGVPDVKIADSGHVFYGATEGSGYFRCPTLDARTE